MRELKCLSQNCYLIFLSPPTQTYAPQIATGNCYHYNHTFLVFFIQPSQGASENIYISVPVPLSRHRYRFASCQNVNLLREHLFITTIVLHSFGQGCGSALILYIFLFLWEFLLFWIWIRIRIFIADPNSATQIIADPDPTLPPGV